MALYMQQWECENAHGVIALVHGLGEFSGRYDWAAKAFGQHGYAVVSADLPGHGRTPGTPGHVNRFSDFLDALSEIIHTAENVYPGLPIILFGHSMGGLISVRQIQTRGLPPSVRAVILSSPSLHTADKITPSPFLRSVVSVLSVIVPTFKQGTGIDPDVISRSHDVRSFYATSNLVLHKASMRLLYEFFVAMDESVAKPMSLAVPILIAQAGSDLLVSVDVNRQFYDRLNTENKTYKLYPECYHELLNEPERESILSDMVAWLHSNGL